MAAGPDVLPSRRDVIRGFRQGRTGAGTGQAAAGRRSRRGKTPRLHATHTVVNLLGTRRVDARQRLVQWRREYLAGVGVDPGLAASVAADLRWDLHALMQLLERGCPPDLAVRILGPLDDRRGQ